MIRSIFSTAAAAWMTVAAFGAAVADEAPLQSHQVKHVLLISVDGLHALDLSNFVATHADSTLAELGRHGVTYSNNSTSSPSDSFPGLASLVTGGSPVTTGLGTTTPTTARCRRRRRQTVWAIPAATAPAKSAPTSHGMRRWTSI